ncbi:Antifreeze glycopeptide AFGP polyprotein precursor [Labilithrix luteola]|uniref:Antifreeze glycopeptide AFGP polyprotein n=1 Tax=Labilithrix luteola TaxID=1391654 RepID=A0A0K1QER0_9BACT|nr:J domain-containing protein [Labilithrix luteola]AKV04244.1 Antifreeze glycopeptide AFGP polyprotein precursor [Labilithrix luteola]
MNDRASREQPTHAWSGLLGARPFVALLADAHLRAATGTFRFRHDARRATLVVRSGRVASLWTSEAVTYLGTVLYERGVIDNETLDATLLEVANSGRLHGQILLERKSITDAQLDAALAEQTQRQALHLFTFPDETHWLFRPDVDEHAGGRDEGRPTVDPWPIMWRGLCANPPLEHVRQVLARLDGGLKLDPGCDLGRFRFSRDELRVCESMTTQAVPIANVIGGSTLGKVRTELLLYVLVVTRAASRVQTDPEGPLALGKEGVLERARKIVQEDPYTVLGLPRGAPLEAARAAFFRLARVWHPDRIPDGVDDALRPFCEQIFARIVDAHRVLTDPRAKAPPESKPSPSSPRAVTLRDVDEALARFDFLQAGALARAVACSGAEGPTARAIVVWCEVRAGVAPNEAVQRAVGELDRLLAGDPDCARALLYRAQLTKRLGRVDAAVRDFRRVLRLEPGNIDAAREMRLHEIRQRASSGEVRVVAVAPTTAAAPSKTGSQTERELSAVRSGLRKLVGRVVPK